MSEEKKTKKKKSYLKLLTRLNKLMGATNADYYYVDGRTWDNMPMLIREKLLVDINE